MTIGSIRRLWIVLLGLIAFSGCGEQVLDTRYGVSRGSSINGISAWVKVLRQRGHRVHVGSAISDRIVHKYPIVIVFHSYYDEMSNESKLMLWDAIDSGALKTLVVVPRDSDAQIAYWTAMSQRSDLAATPLHDRAKQERSEAQSTLKCLGQAEIPITPLSFYGYEKVDRDEQADPIEVLIAAKNEEISLPNGRKVSARWALNRRLVPLESGTVLWKSNDDPLLVHEQKEDISLYVLASAEPILNGGLVDPGNRELAMELANLIGDPSDDIAVFTSSNVRTHEDNQQSGMWKFLTTPPLPWVIGHVVVCLIFFCWYRSPIFGRPGILVDRSMLSFGNHLKAFGELLRKSRNERFAMAKIVKWQQPNASGRQKEKPPDPHLRNPKL